MALDVKKLGKKKGRLVFTGSGRTNPGAVVKLCG